MDASLRLEIFQNITKDRYPENTSAYKAKNTFTTQSSNSTPDTQEK